MKLVKVKSLSHLDDLLKSNDNFVDCFIQLNFGIRSSKEIFKHTDGTYEVTNCIDGTTQYFSKEDIFDENITHIGQAIKKGAFYFRDYSKK